MTAVADRPIASVAERLEAFDREQIEQEEKLRKAIAAEERALEYDALHPIANSFLSGGDGHKARLARRAAEDRLANLTVMRQKVAQEAASEKAAAWVAEVDAAAEVFPAIVAKAEAVYTDVARKLAEIVEADWPRLAAVVAEYADALSGPQNALSEVRSIDPAAAGRFDFAASWPHGQLPANAVEFVNVVLSSLLNRVHADVRAPREVEAIVTPLAATPALLTPPAPLRSLEWDKSALSNAARLLGEAAARTEAAFNPPLKPEPSAEEIAEEAERAAGVERWFAANRARDPHFGRPRGWTSPTPIEAAPEPDPALDDAAKAFLTERDRELRRMGLTPAAGAA